MNADSSKKVCRSCGYDPVIKYCPNCGQSAAVKRITLKDLLHEVFHTFTHIDKGILYTLKELIKRPGTMQKSYVEGDRVHHQKPFSMFFISATVSALIYYLVNTALINFWGEGDVKEADFFRHYWALFQICLFPLHCLITRACFYGSGYNFGETAVFQCYMFSFLFLVLSGIQLLKLIFHGLETRYIELPVLIIYTLITNLHFFTRLSKTGIVIRGVIAIVVTFAAVAALQDELIRRI